MLGLSRRYLKLYPERRGDRSICMRGRFGASNYGKLLAVAGLVCLCGFCIPRPCLAYSVLTHQAIIDAEWEATLKPLLLARFPNATPEQLHQAQAYAYGGCVIQDMGYYPFGSRFFSHLTHYVRSGDFVQALFEEARDINDYAFALGALSHYDADIYGHSLAVNRAVALLYPGLHKKYGEWITWEESPWAHSLTEFAFDTLEVVDRHVAPQKYHDWIGFKVPKPVLERAFKKTYGMELRNQIWFVRLALFSYRKLASQIIPEMTEVTWALRKNELEADASSLKHKHLYHLSRAGYAGWRKTYSKPGIGDKLMAQVFRLVPKVGPFNAIQFHTPTEQTEQLFADSLKATVQGYESQVRAVEAGRFDPTNMDLDTGQPTRPGEYLYCDRTYATVLHKLESAHFAAITPSLRSNLLSFFSNSADNSVRKHHRQWRQVLRELDELKAAVPSSASGPTVTSAMKATEGPPMRSF